MNYYGDEWPDDGSLDVSGWPQSPLEKMLPFLKPPNFPKWEEYAVAYLDDPQGPNLGPVEVADHDEFVKNFAQVDWSEYSAGTAAGSIPPPVVPYGTTKAIIDHNESVGPFSLSVTFLKKSTGQTISVHRLALAQNKWVWLTDPIVVTVAAGSPVAALKAALLDKVVWPDGVSVPPLLPGVTKAIVHVPDGADMHSSDKISVQLVFGTKKSKVWWWQAGAWSGKVTPGTAITADALDTPEKLDAFFDDLAANPPADEKGLSLYSDGKEVGTASVPDDMLVPYVQFGPMGRPQLIQAMAKYDWPMPSYAPYLPAKARMVKIYDGKSGKYPVLTVEVYSHAGLGATEQLMYAVQWSQQGSKGMWTGDVEKVKPVAAPEPVAAGSYASGGLVPASAVVPGSAFGDKLLNVSYSVHTKQAVAHAASKVSMAGLGDGSEGFKLVLNKGTLNPTMMKMAINKAGIPAPPIPLGATVAWIYTHPDQETYVRVLFEKAVPVAKALADVVWVPERETWMTTGWWRPLYQQWVLDQSGVSIVDQSWSTEKCETVRWGLKWLASQGKELLNPTPDLGPHQFSAEKLSIKKSLFEPEHVVFRYAGQKLWDFTWREDLPFGSGWSVEQPVLWYADGHPQEFSAPGPAAVAAKTLAEQKEEEQYDTLLGPKTVVADSPVVLIHDGTGMPDPHADLGYWYDSQVAGGSLIKPSWPQETRVGVLATLHWLRSLTTKDVQAQEPPDEAIGAMEWLDDTTLALSVFGYGVGDFRWSPGAQQWYLWRGVFHSMSGAFQKEQRATWQELSSLHGDVATQKIWEEEAAFLFDAELGLSELGSTLRKFLKGVALAGTWTSKTQIVAETYKALKAGKPVPSLISDPAEKATEPQEEPVPAAAVTQKWKFSAAGKSWYVTTDKWTDHDYALAQNLVAYLTTHDTVPTQILENLAAPHDIITSVDNWDQSMKYKLKGELVVILTDKGDGWKPNLAAMMNEKTGGPLPPFSPQEESTEDEPVEELLPGVSKVDGGYTYDAVEASVAPAYAQKWIVQFKGQQWTVKTDKWSQLDGAIVAELLGALETSPFGSYLGAATDHSGITLQWEQDGGDGSSRIMVRCKGVVFAVFTPLVSEGWSLDMAAMEKLGHLDFGPHPFAAGIQSPFQQGASSFHANKPVPLTPQPKLVKAKHQPKPTASVWQVFTPWGALSVHSTKFTPSAVVMAQKALEWAVKQKTPPTEGSSFGLGVFTWGYKGGYQGTLTYLLFDVEVIKLRWCTQHQVLEPEPGQGLATHAAVCEVCEKPSPGCGCIADPMTEQEYQKYTAELSPEEAASYTADVKAALSAKKYTAELSDMPKPQKWIDAAKKEIGEMASWEKEILGLTGLSDVDAAVTLLEHKKLLGHYDRVAKLKDLGEWD